MALTKSTPDRLHSSAVVHSSRVSAQRPSRNSDSAALPRRKLPNTASRPARRAWAMPSYAISTASVRRPMRSSTVVRLAMTRKRSSRSPRASAEWPASRSRSTAEAGSSPQPLVTPSVVSACASWSAASGPTSRATLTASWPVSSASENVPSSIWSWASEARTSARSRDASRGMTSTARTYEASAPDGSPPARRKRPGARAGGRAGPGRDAHRGGRSPLRHTPRHGAADPNRTQPLPRDPAAPAAPPWP